jgi:cytidylate kinase
MIITLDGPAGAGKSTTARALAARLGWCYMDTGAMYRSVALTAVERGIPLDDAARLAELASSITIEFQDGRVLVDGHDVTRAIRTDAVTAATRPVADAPEVRTAMKTVQRRMATGMDVVTEGRDQGSVVFPHAELKIFLTAAASERARRRHQEQLLSGDSTPLASILEAQTRRDDGDVHRAVGGLKAAADAIVIETDGLDQASVITKILDLVATRRSSA